MSVDLRTIGELDSYLFFEGTHTQSYGFMGAHEADGAWDFVLWAPNAQSICVIGDFNDWAVGCDMMEKVHDNGLWLCRVENAKAGDRYRYAIRTLTAETIEKCDPYAKAGDANASVLEKETAYAWNDAAWLAARAEADHRKMPMNVYEVLPAAWMRKDDGTVLSWNELADKLCAYVLEMGYTHVALPPQTRRVSDDILGYKVAGYFQVDRTHGDADDLKHFVDVLHQNGIGVMMDFVPAKFAKDPMGLSLFDGSPCYEPLFAANTNASGEQSIFNFGRNEVRSFLSSAVNFWANEFHMDALRVCNVSEILYRDFDPKMAQYARKENENSEGVALVRFINDSLHKQHHGFLCIAQEETTWPLVTAPPYAGGLGFDYKWNLGWVSDTLQFMQDDPVYHPYHHNALTFPMMYAFSENYILPLSHMQLDGRRTYLSKMPGGYASQAAQVRLLLGYQFTHPGKKLGCMGTELGLQGKWDAAGLLDWETADQSLREYVKALNAFYRKNPALHACDNSWDGYRWLNANDADRSVLSYIRTDGKQKLIVLCNFSPVKWNAYQVPLPMLPEDGKLAVVFNSDAAKFGGTDAKCEVQLLDRPVLDMPCGFSLDLPAFSTIVLAYNN